MFVLTDTVLHQSDQFEFLVVSVDNVFGQVRSVIMVYFGARQLLELRGWRLGGVPLAENNWIGLLGWFPTQVRL